MYPKQEIKQLLPNITVAMKSTVVDAQVTQAGPELHPQWIHTGLTEY